MLSINNSGGNQPRPSLKLRINLGTGSGLSSDKRRMQFGIFYLEL